MSCSSLCILCSEIADLGHRALVKPLLDVQYRKNPQAEQQAVLRNFLYYYYNTFIIYLSIIINNTLGHATVCHPIELCLAVKMIEFSPTILDLGYHTP